MECVPRALAHNIDLGFESGGTSSQIHGDDFLLREMLGNLIDNAIHYTQPGGHVTVRVSREHENLLLSVEDDGPGIPEAEREAVLERFHRVLGTGVEGAGLGLSIVREIVTRHGGQIRLLSGADNRGTLALVTLPLTV
jgi:two-component system sensor histidine kinase TctE